MFGVSGTGGSLNLGKGSGKVGGHITRLLTTKLLISVIRALERSESCKRADILVQKFLLFSEQEKTFSPLTSSSSSV